jgi:hypothetical protein
MSETRHATRNLLRRDHEPTDQARENANEVSGIS